MTASDSQRKRPSVLLFATEGIRALMEYGTFYATQPILQKVGSGDGHPVLVLPGFLTNDFSTRPLRQFLDKIGYQSHPWKLGCNFGSPRFVDKCVERVRSIYEAEGRKVSIIGWSLGGVYAREVARKAPEMVRQVITLGSPFAGLKKKNNVSWIYNLISGKRVEDLDDEAIDEILEIPPVPATAIYSKGDGIVSWQDCVEAAEGTMTQNVQVKGSHCGLGVNPSVLLCIADRLSQHENNWLRFEPKWYAQFFYPAVAG